MPRLPAIVGRFGRPAAGLLLLGLLIGAIQPGEALSLVARADLGLLCAGLGLVQLQIVGSALRWRFTAGRLGVDVPLGTAIREYYFASFVNLVAPGGVAGDALRAVRTPGGSRNAVVRSVVLERLAGQLVFLGLTAGGLAAAGFGGFDRPPGAAGVVVAVAGVLVSLGAGIALAARFGPLRVRTALAGLWPDIRRAWFSGVAPLVQGGLGLLVAGSYIAAFAIAGAAIGAPLPFHAVVTLIPLALLAMLLPVSIGGFGAREGAAALLWPLAGLGAAEGAVTAALYGLLALAGALPGALFLPAPHAPTRA